MIGRYALPALLLALLATPAESAPCRRGRFLFPRDMVVLSGPATREAVSLEPSRIALSLGCGGAKPVLGFSRHGTSVRAAWSRCTDVLDRSGRPARVKLKAFLAKPACDTLAGTIVVRRATPRRRDFTAALSRCGDGYLDADNGEQCGDEGATCPPGSRCTEACTCEPPSSTTTLTSSTSTTLPGSFACTEVLGFSQTWMWYNAVADDGGGTFEPIVDPGPTSTWQLRSASGAGLQWQDPGFAGWSHAPYSPCSTSSSNPDRVLLNISCLPNSGPCEPGTPSADFWVTNIENEIVTIRQKYSNVRQIILQSVVGGPNGTICPWGTRGLVVHASLIQPNIDAAIAQVVAADPTGQVVAGISPHVRTCADYADSDGHLCYPGFNSCNLDARGPLGTVIGQFYAGFAP